MLEEEDPQVAHVGVRLRRDGGDCSGRHGQFEIGILGAAFAEPRLAFDQPEDEIARNVGEAHRHLGGFFQRRGGAAGGFALLEEALQDDVGWLHGRAPS